MYSKFSYLDNMCYLIREYFKQFDFIWNAWSVFPEEENQAYQTILLENVNHELICVSLCPSVSHQAPPVRERREPVDEGDDDVLDVDLRL